jgi:phosphoglycerate dehydrogenase-like enzyme
MRRRTFLAGAGVAALATGAATAQRRPKILVPAFPSDQMDDLRRAVPEVDLVVPQDPTKEAEDADATYGFISPEIVRTAKQLKWVQIGSAGVEGVVNIPGIVASDIIVTNMQRVYGPEIADQAMGYLLALVRGLPYYIRARGPEALARPRELVLDELAGKTMLVIGLGGIGTDIARRANACGMTIVATDPKVTVRPPFVAALHRPDAFHQLLPTADVVASAVPLTPLTERMIGADEFGMMKRGVVLINVSRGKVVDTLALVHALDSGQVSAAGLDVTDPEPLPVDHPLRAHNVIVTPHTAGQSPGGVRRAHEVYRENLRRFAHNEPLLNVVDKKAGY